MHPAGVMRGGGEKVSWRGGSAFAEATADGVRSQDMNAIPREGAILWEVEIFFGI